MEGSLRDLSKYRFENGLESAESDALAHSLPIKLKCI